MLSRLAARYARVLLARVCLDLNVPILTARFTLGKSCLALSCVLAFGLDFLRAKVSLEESVPSMEPLADAAVRVSRCLGQLWLRPAVTGCLTTKTSLGRWFTGGSIW